MNLVRPSIFWTAKYWLGKAGRRYAGSVRPQRCDGTQGADFSAVSEHWALAAGTPSNARREPQRCDRTRCADFSPVAEHRALASGRRSKGKAHCWIDTRRCWLGGFFTRETSVSLRADRGWENSSFPFRLLQEKKFARLCFRRNTLIVVLDMTLVMSLLRDWY